MDLDRLQLLSIELGAACNLAGAHPYCPTNQPERFARADARGVGPLPDDAAAAFVLAARARGFDGLVAFHYYNEPMLQLPRALALMDRIGRAAPDQAFALWTNGTLLDPDDAAWIPRFARVFITGHDPQRIPIYRALEARYPGVVSVRPGGHDQRGMVYGTTPGAPRPCWRPTVVELPVDARGEVHLCCVDWRADEPLGNIQTDPHDAVLDAWTSAAARVARAGNDCPLVCRRCAALRRSPLARRPEYQL